MWLVCIVILHSIVSRLDVWSSCSVNGSVTLVLSISDLGCQSQAGPMMTGHSSLCPVTAVLSVNQKKSTCTIKPATHPQKTISHDCSNLANRTWLPLSWEWFVYAVFMQKSLRWCCIRSGRYRTPTSLPLLHPSPPAPWSMFSRILIMKAAHGV